jgi:hypothetical protein
VQSAVANVRRVLDDLLLVFEYDLDPRKATVWVRKWYHRGLGGSGQWVDVERFGVHILLIRNLHAELTRAINLVVVRTRGAAGEAFTDPGLATIDTGASHAPMQPAVYSSPEAEEAQPYPGLSDFPFVIGERDFGALGHRVDGVARDPDEFVAWIDELVAVAGGTPSGRPKPTIEPLPMTAATSGASSPRPEGMFGRIATGITIAFVALASVVGFVLGGGVIPVGFALGASLAFGIASRQSQPSVTVRLCIGLVAAGLAGAGVAWGSSALIQSHGGQAGRSPSGPRVTRGIASALTNDAVVNAMTGKVLAGPVARTRTQYAHPQVEGGEILRACDLSSGTPCILSSSLSNVRVGDQSSLKSG